MRVSEAIREVLARERVAHVFGLMGHGNIKVIPHLAGELGIPFVAARHEANAMLMADAYARVTGRVGVCAVTQGPGLTNTMTALVTARNARTRMVVLAGNSLHVDGNLQWIDQAPIFAAAGVPVQAIDRVLHPAGEEALLERGEAGSELKVVHRVQYLESSSRARE